jgi:DNA-binding transcriptional MerR regulator
MPRKSGKRRAAPANCIVQTQLEAAQRLGVEDRTLRRWMKNPGFPECSAGFDIQAIRAFLAHQNKPAAELRSEYLEHDVSIKRDRAEQERIKTANMRHEFLENEKQLLPRRAVELSIALILTRLRDWAEQLPDLVDGHCCRKCRPALGKHLKEELGRVQTEAARDLANLDAGPERFEKLIDALMKADQNAVAGALTHVTDPMLDGLPDLALPASRPNPVLERTST